MVAAVALFTALRGWGQNDEPILLANPSFEDLPLASRPPAGWYDCGFPEESPPDTQPGAFEVDKPPYDGQSYLGMVVRDNDTWESVSQRLSRPLEPGKCYEFTLYMARSMIYVSQSRLNNQQANYTTPAKLRIWGGAGFCNKAELLAESNLVINERWLQYNFRFEPKQYHTFIVLEAYYKTPTLFPYNGHILIDNASPIYPVPCDEEVVQVPEQPLDAIPQPEEEHSTPSPSQPQTTPPQPPPPPEPPVTQQEPPPQSQPTQEQSLQPRILKELDRAKIREGTTLRIEQLYFAADSDEIREESYPVLEEIYRFLRDNPDVVVEIGGHTNTIPDHEYCDRLSTARAKAVVDWLVAKGIEPARLTYKGYGKRHPIVANDRYSLAARQKNQRVEIKILSIGEQ